MDNSQSSFWQFSDQLRLHTNNLANLSLNDSIWSNSYVSKSAEGRRNFDIRVGGEVNSANKAAHLKPDFNGFNDDGWNKTSNISDGWNKINNITNSNNASSNLNGFNDDGWNKISNIMNSNNSSSNINGFNDDGWNKISNILNSNNSSSNISGFNDDGWNKISNIINSNNNINHNSSGLGSLASAANKNGVDSIGVGLNGGFNKGIYSSPSLNFSYSKGINNVGVNGKGLYFGKGGKGVVDHSNELGVVHVGKSGKKNKAHKDNTKESNNNNNGEGKNSVDKRFKTLPPSEALPRNETIGGYIFVCNNDTMQENLKRQLFGLPPRYRDSVRAITPGLPLFLYNYSTHQLHGIFEAASFGGTNIDHSAWEDKKNPGESRFPAQVRVVTRKICEPLEEDSFRPILHHYDGPKFRLELSIPEALSLLDVFHENNSWIVQL